MIEKIIVALGLHEPVSILIALMLVWTWSFYIPKLEARIKLLEERLQTYNDKFKDEFFGS